jgi:hypothetical protein
MRRRAACLCLVGVMAASAVAAAPLLEDDFTTASSGGRRPLRGGWTFAAGVASCTQDDDLYKKYKNHGPIIFYDLPFDDATVTFAFKAEQAKAVVFTANGEKGHVFRVSWGPRGTAVRAFPPESKEKSISVGQDEKPLAQGVWIPVRVTLAGPRATVTVGDAAPQVYEHESFARPKTNISVGFSFGSLNVRELRVEP